MRTLRFYHLFHFAFLINLLWKMITHYHVVHDLISLSLTLSLSSRHSNRACPCSERSCYLWPADMVPVRNMMLVSCIAIKFLHSVVAIQSFHVFLRLFVFKNRGDRDCHLLFQTGLDVVVAQTGCNVNKKKNCNFY